MSSYKSIETNLSREHHFKTEEAEKYGIEKAVLLYNLRFWLDKNKANKTNIEEKDGVEYFWTYNSSTAFGELFPYFNERTIRRWLQELEEDQVIISGGFNKMGYDKTKWYTMKEYTVAQNDQSIGQNDQSIGQNDQPIPDSKPNNKLQIQEPPPFIETNNNKDMKFTTKSEKEKLISGVYASWIKMAMATLDVEERDIDKSSAFMRAISNAVRREPDWTLEDFKSLFKYFFTDDKMPFEKKLSASLCLSSTYISQYKLSKKGAKKKYSSFADVSGDIKL